MTKIRPQDTLNHIFPEKGFFYALALVKYRCCILKIPGLGPAPVLQRILYTQISRAQTRSCSAAYTVYSKCRGTGWFLLGSVYCILKMPGHGLVSARQRILYTQISRTRASSCSAAYTVYSNFQSPGSLLLGSVYCILKFPRSGPAPARQRILIYSNFQSPGLLLLGSVYLYTQNARVRAGFYSAAYTVYSKCQGTG